jgi:hypothetical protein
VRFALVTCSLIDGICGGIKIGLSDLGRGGGFITVTGATCDCLIQRKVKNKEKKNYKTKPTMNYEYKLVESI